MARAYLVFKAALAGLVARASSAEDPGASRMQEPGFPTGESGPTVRAWGPEVGSWGWDWSLLGFQTRATFSGRLGGFEGWHDTVGVRAGGGEAHPGHQPG